MQQLPLHSHPGWAVCLSVPLCGCPAGPCPAHSPGPTGPAPSIGRSVINGARGAPGAGRDQRGPKRWTWDGNRDPETDGAEETETETRSRETWNQRHERERSGDTETGGHDPETEKWGPRHGASNPDTQGKKAGKGTEGREQGPSPGGPDRTEAGDRDGRGGRQRPRDGRDEERRGGSVGAGPGAPIPRLLVITCPEEAAGS